LAADARGIRAGAAGNGVWELASVLLSPLGWMTYNLMRGFGCRVAGASFGLDEGA